MRPGGPLAWRCRPLVIIAEADSACTNSRRVDLRMGVSLQAPTPEFKEVRRAGGAIRDYLPGGIEGNIGTPNIEGLNASTNFLNSGWRKSAPYLKVFIS